VEKTQRPPLLAQPEKTAPDLAAPELMLARAVAVESDEGGWAAERGGESHGGACHGSADAAAWPRCTTPRRCSGGVGAQRNGEWVRGILRKRKTPECASLLGRSVCVAAHQQQRPMASNWIGRPTPSISVDRLYNNAWDVFDSVSEMYERVFRPEARTPILLDESSTYFLSSTRCDETVDHPEANSAEVFSNMNSGEAQRRVDFGLLHRNTDQIVYGFGITM
jgi:hypothetical protein